MNPLIQLKTTPPLLITLALVCFGLSPTAKALLPAPSPDGGYPGGNTAEGINALHDVNTVVGINNTAVGANALTHDTTGQYNVAVGSRALENNTTGDFNMAIGTEALQQNNANFNSAIGFRVLFMNTTGKHLTGVGAAALRNNTTASENTAIGAHAMRENTTGEFNTAIGADVLSSNTTGSQNTAVGTDALFNNTTGDGNTATGVKALFNNTTGIRNTANGASALSRNTTGKFNTANGVAALFNNTDGRFNTANGDSALSSNTTGDDNTATGYLALANNTTGSFNTAIGSQTLGRNTTGRVNIALGYNALPNNTTGFSNTAVGFNAGFGITTANHVICIGSAGGNVNDSTWIENIYGVATQSGTTASVVVSDGGQLGTVASSERFKKDISTMEKASEAILSLRPVTFHYKTDTKDIPQFGLIAEEVARVNPALVLPDKEGKPYTVRYDAVNAMLLNEFLKEHRKNEEQGRDIQEQKATIAVQQKQIDALTAGLQKVSAQVEASKPAPQVVNNP